jgi:hypothetical protein
MAFAKAGAPRAAAACPHRRAEGPEGQGFHPAGTLRVAYSRARARVVSGYIL